MPAISAFNLQKWIREHADELRPPTGAARIWDESDFWVNVLGGPNERTDFHDDPLEEFFYQIKGGITLRVIDDGRFHDVPINEGDVLLLPPHVRHSPQRPANTLGLVIERKRPQGMKDGVEWYCEQCRHLVFRREAQVTDLARDLKAIFDEYYADASKRICPDCGFENPGRPASKGT
jgi:3-hydroxyanthranilate 3,4-dioxygenase